MAFKVRDENELTENLLKDFNNNNNSNKENVKELNNYGEEILTLTTQEILKLKNEI